MFCVDDRVDAVIELVTKACRKEMPEVGPWGLRVEPHVVIGYTGMTEVRSVSIRAWVLDRWVWWVSTDLGAIKWQYRQALMKRHYEDRRAA